MIDPTQIPGYGADADPSRRPGVPKERPAPRGGPEAMVQRQESDVRVFMHGRENKTFPPVYGTAQPPHGLSGRVRALAYSYPDHVTRHWMLLLLADRIDLWERRLVSGKTVLALAALALGGGIVVALRNGRRARRQLAAGI